MTFGDWSFGMLMQPPRVAPPSRLSGVEDPGGIGARKACASSLPSEVKLDWGGICAGTLTADTSVKAIARKANITKRDERLNQAMSEIFSGRAESLFKDGRTDV